MKLVNNLEELRSKAIDMPWANQMEELPLYGMRLDQNVTAALTLNK